MLRSLGMFIFSLFTARFYCSYLKKQRNITAGRATLWSFSVKNGAIADIKWSLRDVNEPLPTVVATASNQISAKPGDTHSPLSVHYFIPGDCRCRSRRRHAVGCNPLSQAANLSIPSREASRSPASELDLRVETKVLAASNVLKPSSYLSSNVSRSDLTRWYSKRCARAVVLDSFIT